MRNETEFTVRADTGEYAKRPNNIIRNLAGYSSQSLHAQIDLTTKSLGMAAAAIDTSNDGDLRRWNRLAKLATEVVDARLRLRKAMVQWSDVVESEIENLRMEVSLLSAMADFDEVTKLFYIFGTHF